MEKSLFAYVQLGTVLTFIITLFVLYRVYVQQKDAAIGNKDTIIQLLKEKNEWLQNQLDVAKESSPDVLMKILNERVKVLTDQIELLSKDKDDNQVLLQQKTVERDMLRFQMSKLVIGVSRLMKELQAIIDEEEALDNGESVEKTADQLNP